MVTLVKASGHHLCTDLVAQLSILVTNVDKPHPLLWAFLLTELQLLVEFVSNISEVWSCPRVDVLGSTPLPFDGVCSVREVDFSE